MRWTAVVPNQKSVLRDLACNISNSRSTGASHEGFIGVGVETHSDKGHGLLAEDIFALVQ